MGPLQEDLNFFDGILYINLPHRQDRKKRILQELQKLCVQSSKIHRIDAFYDPFNGHRGCAKSHRKALDFAIEQKWKNVLILEDDCVFSEGKSVKCAVEALKSLKSDWDAFLFGGNFYVAKECSSPALLRVYDAQRAHAYAVQGPYFPILRNCYEEAITGMKNILFFFDTLQWCLDQRWKLLQASDRWYTPKQSVAFQGESFSDICYMDLMER